MRLYMAATISGKRRSFLVKKPLNADKSPGPMNTYSRGQNSRPLSVKYNLAGRELAIRAPHADTHTDN